MSRLPAIVAAVLLLGPVLGMAWGLAQHAGSLHWDTLVDDVRAKDAAYDCTDEVRQDAATLRRWAPTAVAARIDSLCS